MEVIDETCVRVVDAEETQVVDADAVQMLSAILKDVADLHQRWKKHVVLTPM